MSQALLRELALNPTVRLDGECASPADSLRKAPRSGLQLCQIAEVAREGLPMSGPFHERNANVGGRGAAIGTPQLLRPSRRQALQDTDEDVVIDRKGRERPSEADRQQHDRNSNAAQHVPPDKSVRK